MQDTKEWTPPPLDDEANDHDDHSTTVDKYMVLLRRYTELVLHSGRAKKGLWASTTPMMHGPSVRPSVRPSDIPYTTHAPLMVLVLTYL